MLSRRRRGGLRVAGSASGARSASPDGDAAGGGGGAGGEASGEALMAELLRAGLLLRHTTGTVSIMRLCVPGVGNVVRHCTPSASSPLHRRSRFALLPLARFPQTVCDDVMAVFDSTPCSHLAVSRRAF